MKQELNPFLWLLQINFMPQRFIVAILMRAVYVSRHKKNKKAKQKLLIGEYPNLQVQDNKVNWELNQKVENRYLLNKINMK